MNAPRLPTALLALTFSAGVMGCESFLSDGPQGAAPASAAPKDFGLGDRLAYMASADSHATSPGASSPFRFAEVARESGIDFVHESGTTAERLFPTAFGSGVALLDYDGDGRLDLYFCNGTRLDAGDPVHPAEPSGPNRLYRNLGGGRFRDATAGSGLGVTGYTHGAIAGDLDNDGDPDVFLCRVGRNALFENQGDGTFRDVSTTAGVDRPTWSSGGALIDYDNDGDLDVMVANYGPPDYLQHAHRCGTPELPVYCSPGAIPTTRHTLYRNEGRLTFTDATESAGLGRTDGRGFGVVAADLNGDHTIDLYVANDLRPNFLFLNRGDGTFEDASEASGAAYDAQGAAQSSMGVDAEDADGDGAPDLLVTNFQYEYTTFYQNHPGRSPPASGSGPRVTFQDASAAAGLVADSRPYVGWGCALADFDNDGWPDAFVTNGHLDSARNQIGPTLTYLEPPMLHRNVAAPGGPRRFLRATRDAGPYFAARHSGRGAATGDLDDDGDLDIVINHRDAPPALLRNDTPSGGNRWVRLVLVGTRSNRDALGTRVEIEAGGRTIIRQRKGGCSMQSTNDPRLLIGLGAVERAERVTLHWPSGTVSKLGPLALDASYQVVEPSSPDEQAVALPLR